MWLKSLFQRSSYRDKKRPHNDHWHCRGSDPAKESWCAHSFEVYGRPLYPTHLAVTFSRPHTFGCFLLICSYWTLTVQFEVNTHNKKRWLSVTASMGEEDEEGVGVGVGLGWVENENGNFPLSKNSVAKTPENQFLSRLKFYLKTLRGLNRTMNINRSPEPDQQRPGPPGPPRPPGPPGPAERWVQLIFVWTSKNILININENKSSRCNMNECINKYKVNKCGVVKPKNNW